MSSSPKKTKKKLNKNPKKLKKYTVSEKLEIIQKRDNGDTGLRQLDQNF